MPRTLVYIYGTLSPLLTMGKVSLLLVSDTTAFLFNAVSQHSRNDSTAHALFDSKVSVHHYLKYGRELNAFFGKVTMDIVNNSLQKI